MAKRYAIRVSGVEPPQYVSDKQVIGSLVRLDASLSLSNSYREKSLAELALAMAGGVAAGFELIEADVADLLRREFTRLSMVLLEINKELHNLREESANF